jgi:hypothetical protein
LTLPSRYSQRHPADPRPRDTRHGPALGADGIVSHCTEALRKGAARRRANLVSEKQTPATSGPTGPPPSRSLPGCSSLCHAI